KQSSARFKPRSKRKDHDYLFTTTNGEKPISGFSKAKARLDKEMLRWWRVIGRTKGKDRRKKTFEPWKIHDTRRVVRRRWRAAVTETPRGHLRWLAAPRTARSPSIITSKNYPSSTFSLSAGRTGTRSFRSGSF